MCDEQPNTSDPDCSPACAVRSSRRAQLLDESEILFRWEGVPGSSMTFRVDAAKFHEAVPFVHLPANLKDQRKESLVEELSSKAKSNGECSSSLRGGKVVTAEAKEEILAQVINSVQKMTNGELETIRPPEGYEKQMHDIVKERFEKEEIKVALGEYPELNTLPVSLVNTWSRGENSKMITSAKGLVCVSNPTDADAISHGIRPDAKRGERVCLTVALDATLAVAIAANQPGADMPWMVDGTPYHTQTVDFDESSGSTVSDDAAAKLYIREGLERRRLLFLQGVENWKAFSAVIAEDGLEVVELTDEALEPLLGSCDGLQRTIHGMGWASMQSVAAVRAAAGGGNVSLVITSVQIASTISHPGSIHRDANSKIPFLHGWMRMVALLAGARDDTFPRFTTVADSPLHALLTKHGASLCTELLRAQKLLSDTQRFISPGEAGSEASNATDEGQEPGVHYSRRMKKLTMSTKARSEPAHASPLVSRLSTSLALRALPPHVTPCPPHVSG